MVKKLHLTTICLLTINATTNSPFLYFCLGLASLSTISGAPIPVPCGELLPKKSFEQSNGFRDILILTPEKFQYKYGPLSIQEFITSHLEKDQEKGECAKEAILMLVNNLLQIYTNPDVQKKFMHQIPSEETLLNSLSSPKVLEILTEYPKLNEELIEAITNSQLDPKKNEL